MGSIGLAGYSDFTVLARGGDSVVYRARQNGLDRDVAVKVVQLDDPAAIARFQRELEITVRLGRQHPHIVTVLDTGMLDTGQPCLVMEHYERGSLHDRLRDQGPLAVAEVVSVGWTVADALAFAHDQGVLHRDVKPQNILVLPTSYVLADFGIARRADAEHSASLELFSYRHAAPQVLDGEHPTVADDLYSLGSTLFTLLDGRAPFAAEGGDADTPLAYLRRVRGNPPRALTRPDVPADLVAVIHRCLAKERTDRFEDADALRNALAAIPATPVAPANADPWAPPPGWAPGSTPAAPPPAPEPLVPRENPPPRTASPVAASALAHLPATPPERPPLRPNDPEPTAAAPREPLEPPAPKPKNRRKVIVLAVVALVVGLAIGVGSALLRSGGQEQRGEPGPGPGAGIPTFTGELPPETGPPQVDVGDPRLAPEITGLDDRSTSAVLRWTDPSDGKAIFVVTQRSGRTVQPVSQIPAGTTQYTVEGLDPTAQQYCFQVIALVDGTQRGVSPERCTGVRS